MTFTATASSSSALAINGSGLIAHSRADDRCAIGCEPEPIAGALAFKFRTVPAGMFAFYAPILKQNGYSPIPLRPGEKRPLMDEWDAQRETPLSDDEIVRISQHAGLGVAGGYGGLFIVDFDTDDSEIIARGKSVLPASLVTKKGRRGFTDFYRSSPGLVHARKFRDPDGKMLIELLGTGQTVIPPTIHPETGKPYEWLTENTLLDTPIDELPQVADDIIDLLGQVLAPWLPKPRTYQPKGNVQFVPAASPRMRSYAMAALDGECRELAAMPHMPCGRNPQLFIATSKLGKYVHHSILSEAELRHALMEAASKCGLVKDDGEGACQDTISSGLWKSSGDELPLLEDRPPAGKAKTDRRASHTGEKHDPEKRDARSDADDDEPLPLVREFPAADEYPVDALGEVMAGGVMALHEITQAPLGICANSTLAVTALAAQAHADIKLPTGETKPLSEYFVTIALSGERKTSVDNNALVPVKERQGDLRTVYDKEISAYCNKHDAWEAQRKKVLADKKLGYEQQTAALEKLGAEPLAPLRPMLTCAEPTIEGLAKLLVDNYPSVGVFASEGGAFVGGHGFTEEAKLRTAAGLSMFWDDGCYDRTRSVDGHHSIINKRLSIHVLLQPYVAPLLYSDPLLIAQGIIARLLPEYPNSRQGQRFWKDVGEDAYQKRDACRGKLLVLFNRKLPIKAGSRNDLAPRTLEFTDKARTEWTAFSDRVERRLGPRRELSPISGLAAKMAEHAARLAGCLAMFENPDAEVVDVDVLKRSIVLVEHYAKTALRLHNASAVDAELLEAQSLLDWLHTSWEPKHGEHVSLTDIMQLGPNSIRDSDKARRLLQVLAAHKHVECVSREVTIRGHTRRQAWRLRFRIFVSGAATPATPATATGEV